VSVLAPCPGVDPLTGANDNSLVVRIAYGERAVLLVGDAEHAEERHLLDARSSLRADVLKVGHHGSRTSTSPELLAAVKPTLAVISSGVRNRFGHPHPTTLATLAASRVPVHRTDRDGAATWTTDGHDAWLTSSRRRGLLDPREASAAPR
jgi:competence protein ComEC